VILASNPPNPWQSQHRELLEPPPAQPLVVYEEEAKSVLSSNDSPDISFTYSVNPYRGCHHACAYCYARPTHEYLDFGAGTDFERRIVVKTNAPELLRRELRAHEGKLRGEVIAFSGVTDCYQPLEASYELTRRCLEACRDFAQPAAVITKGALVERDAALLAELHARAGALVHVSLPFLDAADARALEPQAPSPERRLRTLAALAQAGVPTGVAIAPVIPGLNDHQIPAIVAAAAAAGAQRAFCVLLRLPGSVLQVFEERLRAALPLRADKVLSLLAQMRGGELRDGRFHTRMRGSGERWRLVEQLFAVACRQHGLATGDRSVPATPKASKPRQQELFG
jgi:DNA repair photolyase